MKELKIYIVTTTGNTQRYYIAGRGQEKRKKRKTRKSRSEESGGI